MAISQRGKRILLMQAIFQLPFHNQEEGADLDSICCWLEDRPVPVSKDFASFLDHREKIDQVINSTLVGRDIHRLAKVDLAIIRLTSYEVLYCLEIPAEVGINEAVELAKKSSAGDSLRFINGILGPIVKKYEGRVESRGYQ